MLMRYDPLREFERMGLPQMASLTRRAFGEGFGAMDAYRSEHHVVVRFDLPGVDRDSINVTVEQDVLQVEAERTLQEREGDQWLVAERPHGRFSRQLFLGTGLDTDQIEAKYEAGVLTVTIPVAEQAKPRRIAVADSQTEAVEATTS